jgi:hypothetical protein
MAHLATDAGASQGDAGLPDTAGRYDSRTTIGWAYHQWMYA